MCIKSTWRRATGSLPSGVREVSYQDGVERPSKATAPEVVLGNGVAKTFGADLGKPTLLPGDIVEIGPRRWYVSGIMKESNSSFGSEIWALDTPVQETFGRRNSYSSFVVRTKEEKIGSEAAKKLKENRSGQRSYNAQTEQEYYSKLRGTNDQFRYAIIFVAIILAVGGVLGVMNTMFAAISQRAKDIGVLRLLGFTRFQILCSFLVESLVISMVGGLLGCALGLLFDGTTVSSIVSSGAGGGGKSVILAHDRGPIRVDFGGYSHVLHGSRRRLYSLGLGDAPQAAGIIALKVEFPFHLKAVFKDCAQITEECDCSQCFAAIRSNSEFEEHSKLVQRQDLVFG